MNPPTQPRAPLSITTSSPQSSPSTYQHQTTSPTTYSPSPSSSTYSPLIPHHHRPIASQRRATEPQPPKSATSSFSASPSSPLRFFSRHGSTGSPTRMSSANSGMNGIGGGNGSGSGIGNVSGGGMGGGNGVVNVKRLSEGSRRYSGENRVNVHTECGRHSDEWLFGPMKGAFRRVLSGDREREGKGKGKGRE